MLSVAMCHHVDEALSWEELQERHRSEKADEPRDDGPDVVTVDEPAGEREESEPPAEPRVPADD